MTVIAELTPSQDRIHLYAPDYLNDAIKTIPGSEYRTKQWTVPVSWGSCLRLRGLLGAELEIGPELAAWATEWKYTMVDPGMAGRDLVDGPGDDRLWPFQKAGVAWMKDRSCLLADEVGSGKTVQTIMSGLVFPCLVVAPKSMLYTWQREIEKWGAPGLDVRVATGGAVASRAAFGARDVVIINWENLHRYSRIESFGDIALTEKEKEPHELNERAWATIVVDEAHRAKNPRAKQTRALWAVCHQQKARVIGLTGTPIANQLDELWSIMHAIDKDEYPSKSKWVTQYAQMGWNLYGGLEILGIKPEKKDEFFAILDYRFRRMPKAVTMPSLPPIIGGLSDPTGLNVRLVDMDNKQAKAYKQMADVMVAELETGNLVITSPLQKAMRMMMFAQGYAELLGDGKVQMSEPSCKVDALEELCEEYDSEPIVVFAASRQLINLCGVRLDKKKVRYGSVVGGQSALERQQNIDAFQAGHLPVLLCVVAAGSTGITLTKSRVEVILNRSHSLVDNLQMEGRIHRIGSEVHENVTYIDVVSRGTIEPSVVEALYRKDDNLQEICRDNMLLSKLIRGEA
jgi:SNF2 family DNA or RNA helicase